MKYHKRLLHGICVSIVACVCYSVGWTWWPILCRNNWSNKIQNATKSHM